MHSTEEFEVLVKDFRNCKDIFFALGDENRLHIIYKMLLEAKPNGLRVGEISNISNMTRPAISRHLQILKKSGIINVRKEGTKNYYYLDLNMEKFKNLISVLERSVNYSEQLPYRGDEI